MKKLLAGLGLLIALVVPALALANPPQDNKNGPHKDYISGTATGPLPTPFGTFNSVSTANGTTEPNGHSGDVATGTWATDLLGTPLGDVHLAGDILCINATRGAENGANWIGVITSSNTFVAPVGYGILARWVDNGGGGDNPGDNTPDRNIGFVTGPPGPAPTCPSTVFPSNAITSGDLVVHDGGF
jgi:hypothetical protein